MDSTGTVSEPLTAFTNLHHTYLAKAKNGSPLGLYHTVRHSSGAWDGYASLSAPPDEMFGVGEQTVGNVTHVIATTVSSGGVNASMYHRIRSASGIWGAWGNVNNATGSTTLFADVGLAEVGTDLHVCATGFDGKLYHGIRYSSTGGWTTLNDTSDVAGRPGQVLKACCAGDPDGNLHVVANMTMQGNERRASGSTSLRSRWTFGRDSRASAPSFVLSGRRACSPDISSSVRSAA